jgi:hypothetical protein
VQDVPKRKNPIAPDKNASDFPAQFELVLKALNVETALRTFSMNQVGPAPNYLPVVLSQRMSWAGGAPIGLYIGTPDNLGLLSCQGAPSSKFGRKARGMADGHSHRASRAHEGGSRRRLPGEARADTEH